MVDSKENYKFDLGVKGLINNGSRFVSASIEISRRVQNFVGVFYDAMLSYGCKCSEMLFEAERKEKKFNRY